MAKRKISAKDLATDVKSGRSYEHLLDKYQLSDSELDKFLAALVDRYVLEPRDVPQKKKTKANKEKSKPGLEAVQPGEVLFCPKCGTKRLENAAFCASCGLSLISAPQEVQPNPPPQEGPEQEMLTPQISNCPSCSRLLFENAETCNGCGLNIREWKRNASVSRFFYPYLKRFPALEFCSSGVKRIPDFWPSELLVGTDLKGCLVRDYHGRILCFFGPGNVQAVDSSADIISCHLDVRKRTETKTTSQEKKSVVGRGLGGFLVAGPLGAVLGGMSGVGGGASETVSTDLIVLIRLNVSAMRLPNSVLSIDFFCDPRGKPAEKCEEELNAAHYWHDFISNLKQPR